MAPRKHKKQKQKLKKSSKDSSDSDSDSGPPPPGKYGMKTYTGPGSVQATKQSVEEPSTDKSGNQESNNLDTLVKEESLVAADVSSPVAGPKKNYYTKLDNSTGSRGDDPFIASPRDIPNVPSSVKTFQDYQQWASKMPAPQKGTNGRVKGRALIRWNSDVDQLLLLIIQYQCHKQNIVLPWDEIATRLSSDKFSTGQSIRQHLDKLRISLLEQGRWAPPIMGRAGTRRHMETNIRGVTRLHPKNIGDKSLRYITWNEDASLLINPKLHPGRNRFKFDDGTGDSEEEVGNDGDDEDHGADDDEDTTNFSKVSHISQKLGEKRKRVSNVNGDGNASGAEYSASVKHMTRSSALKRRKRVKRSNSKEADFGTKMMALDSDEESVKTIKTSMKITLRLRPELLEAEENRIRVTDSHVNNPVEHATESSEKTIAEKEKGKENESGKEKTPNHEIEAVATEVCVPTISDNVSEFAPEDTDDEDQDRMSTTEEGGRTDTIADSMDMNGATVSLHPGYVDQNCMDPGLLQMRTIPSRANVSVFENRPPTNNMTFHGLSQTPHMYAMNPNSQMVNFGPSYYNAMRSNATPFHPYVHVNTGYMGNFSDLADNINHNLVNSAMAINESFRPPRENYFNEVMDSIQNIPQTHPGFHNIWAPNPRVSGNLNSFSTPHINASGSQNREGLQTIKNTNHGLNLLEDFSPNNIAKNEGFVNYSPDVDGFMTQYVDFNGNNSQDPGTIESGHITPSLGASSLNNNSDSIADDLMTKENHQFRVNLNSNFAGSAILQGSDLTNTNCSKEIDLNSVGPPSSAQEVPATNSSLNEFGFSLSDWGEKKLRRNGS